MHSTSMLSHSDFRDANSASVSALNRLIQTTAGTPNLRTFSTYRDRLANPFSSAEIGAEAGFGDDVIAELQGCLCGNDGVAAVSDVRERTAVDQCGIVLDRLNKIGCKRILEQSCHRAGRFEIRGSYVLSIPRLSNDHVSETPLEIGQILRQAENRHDF